MSALEKKEEEKKEEEKKKREKKKRYEEIKRGKCPEPRRKEKVRREVKMDKCPIVELGVQNTHLREKKKKEENIEHLILLKKFQKSKKGMYPLKRV